jgi:hypothetical protein
MDNEYRALSPRDLVDKEQSAARQVDARGSAFVNDAFRYAEAHTPSGSAVAYDACDGFVLSADATVTGVLAEGGASLAIPYAGKVWHRASYSVISAVSGGATIVLGWYRKPAALSARAGRVRAPA